MNNASSNEEQKRAEELERLRIAAESGDMNAIYEYGKELAKRGSSNDVLNWLNSCELVDAASFFHYLGICYIYGDGVEKNSKLAFQWFLKAAEQEDAEAQYSVGICYLVGDGVEKDEKKASYWFLKAAEQGVAEAQYNVGISYLKGDGVEKNSKLAFQWFLKAAEQGDVLAQYNVGTCYLDGVGVKKNSKLAFQWFLKAAKKKYAEAQNNVGTCYLNGDGVKKNSKLAFQWFLKAAEQGVAEAQNNVGIRYIYGDGVKKNSKLAFQWFLKAVEQGDAKAQNEVGTCYLNGDGVKKNSKLAFQWFLKAAEQGDAEAQNKVGTCYSNGVGVKKNSKLAFQWFLKAAEQGDALAHFYVGDCYIFGDGVKKNSKLAFQWFLKGAKKKFVLAQYNVGICYSVGEGVEKDEKEAFQWFLKAAEQGVAEAQYNVGISYLKGVGVEKNSKLAFQWLLKAAEQGDAEAQYNVGTCYLDGVGVEKDEKKAFQWFSKAAKQGLAEAHFVVGCCYLNGVGVKKDEELAYHYIFNVAKNGQYRAQCVLGTSFNHRIDYDNILDLKREAYANNEYIQFLLAEMSFWGNDIVPRNLNEAAFWYEKLLNTDLYAEKAKKRLAFMNYFGLGMGKDLEKAKKLWQEIGYSWDNDLRPEQLKEILICFVEGSGRNTYDTPECKLWDKAYIPLKRLSYSHYTNLSFEKFSAFCKKNDLNDIYPISKDLLWNELMNYEEPLKILQYPIQSEELIKAWKDKNLEVFKNLFEKDDRSFLIRANLFFSIRDTYDLKNLEPWSIHTHNKDFLTTDVLSYKFDSDAIKSATNIITKKNECNFSNDLDFAERTIRRDVASCIEAVDDVSGYYNYETRHNMNDILESSEFSEVTNYVKRLLDKKEENSTESNKDNEDYTTIIALLHTLLLNKKKEDFDIFSKDIYDIPPLDNQNLNTSKQSEDELKELGGILFKKNYLPKFRKIAEDIKDLSTAYAFMYMLTMSKCFILEKLLTETYKPIVDSINELLRPIKNREIRQKLILKIEKYEEIINTYKCKEEPEKPWKYIQHFAIELFDLMFQSNIVITELEITKDMVKSKSTVERQMFKKFVLENDLTGEFISKYNVKYEIVACIKYWGSGNVQLSKSSFEKVNKLAARYKID